MRDRHNFAHNMAGSLSSNQNDDLLEGFDVDFVDKTIDTAKIECSICTFILRRPVQIIPCGHRFCKGCIENLKRQQNDAKGIICPLDRRNIENIFEDVGFERDILNHVVKCPNNLSGCPWAQALLYLKNHRQECLFEKVQCRLNCGAVIIRKEMDQHLDDNCPSNLMECKYSFIGCPYKGKPKLLAEHFKENMEDHMYLQVKNQVHEVKCLQEQVKTQNEMIKKQGEKVEKQDEKAEKQDEIIKKQGEKVEKQNEIIQKQGVNAEKQDEIIKKQGEKAEKQNEMIKKQGEKQDQIIKKMNDKQEAIKQMKEEMRIQKELIECLQTKQKQLIEIPIHQTCPFNFTIRNFSSIIGDGKPKQLYSDGFYLLMGYRGYLQVKLNYYYEDYENQYISVGFGIQKGPFDDYLKWPMVYDRITFKMFINGECVKEHNIDYKMKNHAELSNDSFVKPPAGCSLGSPTFYKQDEIPHVIVGDEIKFIVDITSQ